MCGPREAELKLRGYEASVCTLEVRALVPLARPPSLKGERGASAAEDDGCERRGRPRGAAPTRTLYAGRLVAEVAEGGVELGVAAVEDVGLGAGDGLVGDDADAGELLAGDGADVDGDGDGEG